jgi:hypothetical protein
MSLNLPNHYVVSYATNIQLLLQQKGTKLRGAVTEGTYVGKQASPVDQVASVEMTPVTQRFAPKGRVDAAVDRRWVFPSDFDLPQQIDSFDKLRLLTDPESSYVTNAVYAAGRKMDSLIILAFLAAAKTGVDGTTTTLFGNGVSLQNNVTVSFGGTNTKLTVAKLLEVKRMMRANHVDFDMDPVYCALTAADEASLLQEIQITSSDFNGEGMPVLKDGKISRFLGIDFIYCEQVETIAGKGLGFVPTGGTANTNLAEIPVWAKSGMHLGIWNDMQTSITRRYDLQGNPWEAYLYTTFGATRIEENKVYNIESFRA